jgi:site-specific DNA recombinase
LPKQNVIAPYARVLTEGQADNDTVKAHVTLLRGIVEALSAVGPLSVYDLLVHEAVSGTVPLDRRPEGRRLLRDAEAGRAADRREEAGP